MDIELEQLGAVRQHAGFGEADRREARYARDGARVRRGAEHRALALPVEEPLERGGGEEERHRDLAPEQRRPHVDAARKSVVKGTSVSVRVDLGGRRIIKKK